MVSKKLKTKIMNYNNCSNVIGEIICKTLNDKASFLDQNNIVWKMINGEWIGKRSVWTLDRRACWLEDTVTSNVKSWWCGGKNVDYTEIFKRTKPISIESALKYHLKALGE